MAHSINLTRFRFFAALAVSSLLVACGGGGGTTATTPVVVSTITLTANSATGNNVAGTGVIATDTVNNLAGTITVTDTTACAALTTEGGTASVVATGTIISIIPITVNSCIFNSTTGTLTTNERAILLAASSLTLRFVTNTNSTVYTIGLTRS